MDIYEGYNYRINIVGADSTIMVDSNTGLVKASISDVDENIIVDIHTNTLYGTLVGNIVNQDLELILDIDNKEMYLNSITANTLTGTLVGDIVNQDLELILNSKDKEMYLNSLTARAISGNIYNGNGELLLDSTLGIFYGNIEKLDNENNTYSDRFLVNNLEVGETDSGIISIYNNNDIEDGHNALSIYNFKTSNNYSAITLTRGRGTNNNKLPVKAGDKLNAILFSAHSGVNSEDRTPVALFGAKVPDDANISSTSIPGEISLYVNSYNNEFVEGFTVDAHGQMKTVIKDLTVIGNTKNLPHNNNVPDSWLEISVNGDKKFIPLYS